MKGKSMKRNRRLTDEEFLMQPFDFSKARRGTPEEAEEARKAIEAMTGKPRPPRGRPPLPPERKTRLVSVRLGVSLIERARGVAAARGIGYQTLIKETLERHL